MSKYKVILKFSDGTEEEQPEVFDTEEKANEHGGYLAGCCHLGNEEFHLSNPGDYPEDDEDVDWDVIEID